MRQDIKKLWVEALRSGQYEQGSGALSCDGQYCCLGVLCEIAVEQGLELEVSTNDKGQKIFNADSAYLPTEVQEWAQLYGHNPEVLVEDYKEEKLANLNDGGFSFHQIADVIEWGL